MPQQTPFNLAGIASSSDFVIDPTLSAEDAAEYFLNHTGDEKPDTADVEETFDADAIPVDQDIDDATVIAIKESLSQAQARDEALQKTEGKTGDAENPTRNPPSFYAPFAKFEREEDTPNPENIVFDDRAKFNEWLGGESSWCHFVQRRTITPERRAEERLKARKKAHDKAVSGLTSEEQTSVRPLQRRARKLISPVESKVTFTCHHAGSYKTKHSNAVPKDRLRLNVKTSVKCNCPAKVTLTEMQDGECRVLYVWKHEGHDPFAEGELESGRLPGVVDGWLVRQINAGKSTDEIRKALSLTEEEKQEYIRLAAEDPNYITPDMPPPLAFQMQLKYADIYNRFRKLRGPIRAIKIPKKSKTRRQARGQQDATQEHEEQEIESELVIPEASDVQTAFDNINIAEYELGQLTNEHSHADLAQALLRLPEQEPGDQEIEQNVLDIARLAAESVEV